MKVAIVHYHLNPGGVTRIIESHIKGLQAVAAGLDVAVLCGDVSDAWNITGTTMHINSSLNYWHPSWQEADFKKIVARITTFIQKYLDDRTILHGHNISLGKNPALTLAMYNLAMEGYPVVNHCHDFPEQRPANLDLINKYITGISLMNLQDVLYPNLATYHYITLNSSDSKQLVNSGLPVSRVHLLPNPVALSNRAEGADKPAVRRRIQDLFGFTSTGKICTYPVRGIERKNLGEFILLAALFSDRANFTITQAPKNPSELPLYLGWKRFCHDHGIKIIFESGDMVNHEELISISDFCITTSIREGFGMVYLEPWLAGTPVIGRNLPSVTKDLEAYGIEFPRLYSAIIVESGSRRTDFKDLEHGDQELLIQEVVRHKSSGMRLISNNSFLSGFLDDVPADTILNNQRIVQERFSLEKNGKELLAIYNEVSQ